MMRMVMRSRLLAMLLSVPVAASGAAGVALHVCQSMGGVAVGDCDCEKQADHGSHADHSAHAPHEAAQKIQGQPCCSVELTKASAVVATHEASTLRIEDAPVAIVGLSHPPVPRSRLVGDPGLLRERAPPNVHGPPLFVRNCAFLN